MKTRKITAIILTVLLVAAVLTGCSNGYANKDAMTENSGYPGSKPGAASPSGGADAPSADDGYYYDKSESMDMEAPTEPELDGMPGESTRPNLAEKIIYTADMNVETITFDESIEKLEQMISDMGGFIESSYISGNSYSSSYYGYKTYRNANFTIRVPVEVFEAMTGSMSEIGTVTYTRLSSQNVTSQYYDLQARIEAYSIEEQSLLEILEKCETVEDLIYVQNRLSEVRYQIEYYQTTLNHLDQQVRYSTIQLSISEVAELSRQVPVQRTYWQQIGDDFIDSLDNVADFFKDLFRGIIGASPVLVIVAVFAAGGIVIVVRVIRTCRRKHAARKAASAASDDIQE